MSLKDSGGIFDVERKDEEIIALQSKMTEAGFWQEPQAANQIVQKLKSLKNICDSLFF